MKIKQDLEYGWTTRYLKGYAMNNAVILNDYIIPHQINKFEANDSIVNLFDAINITAGLPFIRVSPDHGPNEKMLGKNVSSPLSLYKAISFLERLK